MFLLYLQLTGLCAIAQQANAVTVADAGVQGTGYYSTAVQQKKLKGYSAFFFSLMWLHPKSGSLFERKTFQHYLNATGATFYITDEEFSLIKTYVLQHRQTIISEKETTTSPLIYRARVNLYGLSFVDNALGSVIMYFDAGTDEPFALYDVFNFNKAKAGKRKLHHELQTRLVQTFRPRKVKEFVICYSCKESAN